jgi:hypothetical protein
MQFPSIDNPATLLLTLFITAVVVVAVIGFGMVFFYFLMMWIRHRKREVEALNSTLLQVTVPRDNEIKIDAAEQMFSALYAIRKTYDKDRLAFFKSQPHLSFEIVGLPGDIRFYVNVPNKLRDLVEKQINGSYPDAEIIPVTDPAAKQRAGTVLGTEYNIFSKEGKVAFVSLRLKGANHMPIKAYKDLPVDSLSSITSVLAKMGEGEGAALQIIISPASAKWKKEGRSFIGHTKKNEANPEKASYKSDARELEAIEGKIQKPGFDTTVRIVVSAKTYEAAKSHVDNIKGSFSQFTLHNSFTKNKNYFKGWFMNDFIYRYFPMTHLFLFLILNTNSQHPEC